MSEAGLVVVTGATGKLGTAACRSLIDRGHRIRATDQKFVRDFPSPIEIGDLRDEAFVYRVLQGASAVVHLGNHPNGLVGPSPQRILAENTAMNANVFLAAVDLGIRCIAFASSVQVTVPRDHRLTGPHYPIPYLPLDGALPRNPGLNTYGQSKEIAERSLELLAEGTPGLSATALRFPMLVGDWWVRRVAAFRSTPLSWVDFAECTSHLFFDDAARLLTDVVERRLPGYHQYFPAVTMTLPDYPRERMVAEHYPGAELRRPLHELDDLVDVSAITAAVGWTPQQRLTLTVEP